MAFFERELPHRHAPAEYCRYQRGWLQDGRQLRNVKPKNAFVWPKDGKNGSTWGRFKDILSNKGPDIYLTMNADKADYMYNRPARSQWSGYMDYDDRHIFNVPFGSTKFAPWTRNIMTGGRTQGSSYDFRTRRYGRRKATTWTDAVWQPEQYRKKGDPYPEAVRDINGVWFQRPEYLPQDLSGPVSNRYGRGVPGMMAYPYPWQAGHYFS